MGTGKCRDVDGGKKWRGDGGNRGDMEGEMEREGGEMEDICKMKQRSR